MSDVGRNDPCPCGSGKKYKKCCEAKDEAQTRAALEKQWTKAEKDFEKQKQEAAAEAAHHPEKSAPVHAKPEPGRPMASKHSTIPAPKFNMPRKSGGG